MIHVLISELSYVVTTIQERHQRNRKHDPGGVFCSIDGIFIMGSSCTFLTSNVAAILGDLREMAQKNRQLYDNINFCGRKHEQKSLRDREGSHRSPVTVDCKALRFAFLASAKRPIPSGD